MLFEVNIQGGLKLIVKNLRVGTDHYNNFLYRNVWAHPSGVQT